ncbi:MAG: adenylyltransferase/cytidyltransferase family protein [Candidatus Nanohaloarchaeota archaeon QJJ-5]|nr:adenylyltransferase/cytidyltransferase family protein [Candidatus Nanohaloarchaeota archaeon QJJ-5]
MKRALFIGRFQPLHKGHKHAIEKADNSYDLVIGIGSANQGRTEHNPLHAQERERIISNCFPQCMLRQIPDFDDDDTWLDYLQNNIEFDLVISGNDWVTGLCAQRNIPTEAPAFLEPDEYSGTRIRKRIRNDKTWRSHVPPCSKDILDTFNFEQIIDQV